ncbi:hypothetical protein [Miltoncostaea marina]|uniref:hypothetical protein n=1 Tax=Miltoncostaea marina TaxID=2843215 RepID=UPI001C3E2DE7|nr:hypothetical protein [Miltoncostaea marina]
MGRERDPAPARTSVAAGVRAGVRADPGWRVERDAAGRAVWPSRWQALAGRRSAARRRPAPA